jgi:DNA repair exonuclease SbcCD ATPase subunit
MISKELYELIAILPRCREVSQRVVAAERQLEACKEEMNEIRDKLYNAQKAYWEAEATADDYGLVHELRALVER